MKEQEVDRFRERGFSVWMDDFGSGKEIGIENPDEKEYYETLGRINLYDLSMIANQDDSSLKHYFDTLPMAIIEVKGDMSRFVRTNKAYREFLSEAFGFDLPCEIVDLSSEPADVGPWFFDKIKECCRTGNSSIVDEHMPDGTVVHTFIRNIGTNSVTGTKAVAIAVLSVTEG